MKFFTRRTAVLAILLSAAICPLCQAGLNEKLPADSLATLEWEGRSLVFDGSLVGQAIQDSNFKPIFSVLTELLESSPSAEANTSGPLWDLFGIAWQHPVAMAIDQTGVNAIVLIHLGDDKDAFMATVDDLIKDANPQPGQTGALEFQTIHQAVSNLPMSFGTMGPVFFLTFGKGQPELLANVTPATSILANERYKQNLQAVGGSDEQVRVFVDIDKLYHVAAHMQNPDAAEDAPLPFLPILSMAGVDRLSSAAGTVRIIDKGMYSKLKFFSPAPHRSALLPLAGAPLNDADLAGIPVDADFFLAMNLPLSELLAYIDSACGDGQPDQPGMIEMLFQQFTGVKLQEEFFNAFGDTWVLSSAPSQGGVLTGTVLTLEVKDEELARDVLGKLEQTLTRMLTGGAPDAPPLIQNTQYGKADVHYLSLGALSDAESFNRGLMIPLQPAWSIHEKKLYFALWPQVIGTTLQNTTEKLLQTAEYKTLRSRLSENVSILGYSNNIQMTKRLYPLELLLGSAISNHIKSNLQENLLLPGTLGDSLQYIRPGVFAITSDETGIQLESYQGGLSGSMAGIIPAGAASLLLPALNEVLYEDKIAVSGAILNSIGKAIILYIGSYHTPLIPPPQSFAPLIAKGFLTTDCLISPLSNRPPPTWDPENKKIVGETDYILIPYKKLPKDGTLLHVYERPENTRPSYAVVVLQVHGTVMCVSRETLIQELARARAELKKQGVEFEFVLPPDLKKQLDNTPQNAKPGNSGF